MQGLGAGKQQGAGWNGAKVLLLAALLISLVPHWWRGCNWVYLIVVRPFQMSEIAWILLQGKTHCPFFCIVGKHFSLAIPRSSSPNPPLLSGDH